MATLINGTTLNADITLTKQTGTKVVFDTDQKYVQKDIEINIAAQTATPNFKGGSLNNKDASAIFTNMTTSTADTSGVVIATSGQAGRAAIQYNGAIDGWVSASDNSTAMSALSTDNWAGETYYATGITLTNNKTFNITVPDGDSTITHTVSVDNEGNVSGIGEGAAITTWDELDENGGYIRHIEGVDLSGDTVSPSSLLQGYTAHNALGEPIVGTATQEGGGGSAEKKQVNFIDYDGTILYSYTATEANALTALPSNPVHTGLISQGWNWTLAQIKSQLTVQPDAPVWIGQMYITQSGATEIDVTMTAPDLHPYLGIAVNGTVTIDWGDNTTADTVTGTINTVLKFTDHEYAAAGNYTISINVVSGRFTFYCDSNAYRSVLSETTQFNRSNRYSNDIAAVRIGENAYIGNYAFNYCTALSSITIPDGITSIGNHTFQNCYALSSITIPDGITSIGNNAFRNCYALASITIPDNVTSIETYAFNNCYALTSITIPDSVTSIGTYVFQNCYALSSITIPDGITSIVNNMFYDCYTLASIIIPDSVTSIGDYAFIGCYALTSITIPDGVTSIGISAFNGCYALTSITIPDSVTSIGSSAFRSCYALTSITIPDSVTSIEDNAFNGCYALTSITIPDSVTSIGTYAFNNCYALTNIIIPDGVTSIGTYAFTACYALTSITIPDSVTSIGTFAFYNCYGIHERHFKPTTPPTVANSGVFSSTFVSGAIIYVPTGCLEAYTSATNYPSSSTYTYVEE